MPETIDPKSEKAAWPYGATLEEAMRIARDEVRRLHAILDHCEPDAESVELTAAALAEGRVMASDIVSTLVSSSGFDLRQVVSALVRDEEVVAFENVVQNAYRLLLRRDADESALRAFSSALVGGELTVLEMVAELMGTEEFTHRGTPVEADMPSLKLVVQDVFNLLMSRDADESDLQAFSEALASGELTVLAMIKELLNSTEFGSSALRLPFVSRHVVFTVIRTMMQRDVDEDTLDAYVNSLRSGTELNTFLNEMLSSPEFRNLMHGPNSTAAAAATGVPAELAQLAEGLLVTQMVSEGCCIAAAPYNLTVRSNTPEKQIAALLRTLAMLGRTSPMHSEDR